jgi:hypothetical protein
MPGQRETRTAPLGMRLMPSVKAALDKAAADDHRPVASYVEKLLVEHLRANGYLGSEPPRGNVQVADAGSAKRKRDG